MYWSEKLKPSVSLTAGSCNSLKWTNFAGEVLLPENEHPMKALPVYPAVMPQEAFVATKINDDFCAAGTTMRAAEHLIVWIQSGEAVCIVDGQSFPVTANQLLLISKGQLYSITAAPIPLEGIIIAFGDCFWDKTPVSTRNCKATLFNNVEARRYLPLPEDSPAEIPALLQNVLTEYSADEYTSKPDVLAAYLKILVIKIANLHALLTPQTEHADYLLYQRFMQLLPAGVERNKDVHSFAARLGISDRKLATVCKLYADKGAKEIINDHVVAEAKRLLRFTPKNIKEISYNLNFITPYQFSKFFKKYTSYSPLQYRQQQPQEKR